LDIDLQGHPPQLFTNQKSSVGRGLSGFLLYFCMILLRYFSDSSFGIPGTGITQVFVSHGVVRPQLYIQAPKKVVELVRFELTISRLPVWRDPNFATAP
jgi:hypothetical protein